MKTLFRCTILALITVLISISAVADSSNTNISISASTPTMVLTDRTDNAVIRYSALIYNSGPSVATLGRTSGTASNGLPFPVGAYWYADPPVRVAERNMHDSAAVWIHSTGTVVVIVSEETR